MLRSSHFTRTPLAPARFSPLPLGATLPRGWLKKQLRVMADGITGRLCGFWPDVSDASAWLGGEGEGWERGPYYLDGYLPLAYLLRDEAMIARAQRWVEWSLQSQREDGFFGPEKNLDWWPRAIMLKVLWQYYTASADKRVPVFMVKYFAYMANNLDERPLADWAMARGAENLVTLMPLYALTGKTFLLDLAKKILRLSLDWTGNFHAFPYARPTAKILPWKTDLRPRKSGVDAEGREIRPEERAFAVRQYHFTHVVNNAMALKYPALAHAFTGDIKDESGSRVGFEKLMKHHGAAFGLFNGDEHLSGASPSQGTECCAVVEAMYSAETLFALTGDPAWGDALERLAFNALPGTLTPDSMGHQYLQQANQIKCTVDPRDWYNNGPDANVFGIEPNYGCCTANLHQGWPKYAANLWMADGENGLAALSYAPCSVRWRAGGKPVTLTVDTGYPFEGEVRIRVGVSGPTPMKLSLRIPAWAKDAYVTCAGDVYEAPAGGFAVVDRAFNGGEEITLSLPMDVRTEKWYHQSVSVMRGPVLFALHIDEEWLSEGGNLEYLNREIRPLSPWNYAILPDRGFETHVAAGGGLKTPFGAGTMPVVIEAMGAPVHAWHEKSNSAAPPPVLPGIDPAQITKILLKPYGWAGLHIAQMPEGRVE